MGKICSDYWSVGYGSFYAYNNINLSHLIHLEEITEEPKIVLEYNLNLKGDNISIISSFKDENSAKAMVNDLKVKGYKCDYFYFLINQIAEELYKVYIGPYENNEETNQWIENIDLEFEIIKL